MNLLFIQGGSRWKFDADGNVYTDSNFNEAIWNRYLSYCDNLTVILRQETKIYTPEEANSRFNRFPTDRCRYVALPDMYRPKTNAFSLSKRHMIKKTIDTEVKKADKVIIRSLGNIYTNSAMDSAIRHKKPFLVEVTGFALEGLWYHSLSGKILAIPRELDYRRRMKKVDWASYVTEEALQKRYPCRGKALACSDVELLPMDDTILEKRLKKIAENGDKIVLGTAAFLDVKWKGQEYVVYALGELKKRGIDNLEYQLIGAGNGKRIQRVAEQRGVQNQVKIIGCLPHDQVYHWLDSIDVYVQPSFQEGLCRSIVEAMSRACPVICSDVGGNFELVPKECLFEKASVEQIMERLMWVRNGDNRSILAAQSFETAQKYDKQLLANKRDQFYKAFVEM